MSFREHSTLLEHTQKNVSFSAWNPKLRVFVGDYCEWKTVRLKIPAYNHKQTFTDRWTCFVLRQRTGRSSSARHGWPSEGDKVDGK